ncbi:MAG: N-acetyltransferase family protein [Polyangiaceae bacterium]|jgi:GNAT superfamily N-acetyltransferase
MIRAATRVDVRALHSLIVELARYEKLEHEVLGTEADLAEHLFGARPYAEALVAEDGGVVVGFALFFHNYSTFLARPGLYLEDLFVLPEHRRKGHGLALLREFARIAVERRCGRLEWSVLNWNAPAIAFYRSLGAKPMDEWGIFRMTGEAITGLAHP